MKRKLLTSLFGIICAFSIEQKTTESHNGHNFYFMRMALVEQQEMYALCAKMFLFGRTETLVHKDDWDKKNPGDIWAYDIYQGPATLGEPSEK